MPKEIMMHVDRETRELCLKYLPGIAMQMNVHLTIQDKAGKIIHNVEGKDEMVEITNK